MKARAIILSTVIVAASLAWTPRASAIEAAVTDDTYAYTATNNGATATMIVSATGNRRVFLNFALQQAAPSSPRAQDADGPLPLGLKGEEVTRAVLRMFPKILTGGPMTLRVRAVTQSWNEATLKNATGFLPTWDANSVVAEIQVAAANEYLHFDITSLVQNWVKFAETTPPGAAGGFANFGLVIESTGGAGVVTFDTKESTANFYESVIEILVEPATVPARGDVSMGIFNTP